MGNINEYAIAYAEILEILKYIPKSDYDKIPKEKLNLFDIKKDKKYKFKYNPNKTLEENNVSKRAKAIIIILFRDYWSNDTQRKKIIAKQNNDRKIIELEKIENYNYEDIFKKSSINKNVEVNMEEILKSLEISEKTISQMIERCPNIKELSKREILEKIEILKEINCNNIQIRNIVSSNPMYLDRSNTDVKKLIEKMNELGFSTLNILFDGNPYILNLDAFEIENYIKERQKNGELLEDIVDDMESNLYIFQEI